MTTLDSELFLHGVTTDGPSQGQTFTGRWNLAGTDLDTDTPLVVAIHGGGFTSAYFDVPGYSLLKRAALLGIPAVAVDRPGYAASDRACMSRAGKCGWPRHRLPPGWRRLSDRTARIRDGNQREAEQGATVVNHSRPTSVRIPTSFTPTTSVRSDRHLHF
jgi:pimeloyl-ACP methyl ester carboxylesterase